jgi:hypothetical protein
MSVIEEAYRPEPLPLATNMLDASVYSNQMGTLVNPLYKYPVINAAVLSKETEIPPASINRYLNLLVEAGILYTDNKSRNRTFHYYDLLNIIRD